MAKARTVDNDDDFETPERLSGVRRWLSSQRPHDLISATIAACAAIAILINALFLQAGPHPAPIFANRLPASPVAAPQPAAPATPKPRSDVVADIQRELIRRGFYEGATDGVYGPRTDSAIRDFEHAAGLRPSTEPNAALLQTIQRTPQKAKPATPARNDPIADLLAPNRRVIAVQRALTDYGYGQIKPSGFYDLDTRAAIEQFERERQLPVSGQISDRLVRELSAMTGRPLE